MIDLLIAPWSISLDNGWVELPILIMALAFLIGGEIAADTIEEPFGEQGDDLPLDNLCDAMEGFVINFRDSTSRRQLEPRSPDDPLSSVG